MILITGAGGMLGSYIRKEFSGEPLQTLGLKDENSYRVDLSKESPDFHGNYFETVIHCAGTEDDAMARSLNYDGTCRLLSSLNDNPPRNFIYISSYKVYSRDAGENVTEDQNLWASSEAGKSKARAEEALRLWCKQNEVTLTIIRPARMFGNGVKGESLQLFNDALSGTYIHIRGNDARLSLVTAYDVARGLKKIYPRGGLYNAADGRNPKFIEMVEAMTANAGAKKRMTHLPATWAEWLWRICRFIPAINRNLSPEIVTDRMKTLTLDGTQFAYEAGISYYDTIAVMEHTDSDYPYSDRKETHRGPVHEA